MAYLEVNSPQGRKRLKLSSDSLKIGRYPDNELVVGDDRASRHHCVIEPTENGYRIRDLGSRNGTRLNEDRITSHDLSNGDVVRIGKVEIRFIDPHQPEPSSTPPLPKTPDYRQTDGEAGDGAAAPQTTRDFLAQETLDLDLNDAVSRVQTDYETDLKEIINAAAEKPFEEDDISLLDTAGSVVHQAGSSGVQSGKGESREGLRVFRLLLLATFRARATDLHVEPRRNDALIRLRVDGYLLPATQLSTSLHKRVLGVVKILCHIETTGKISTQDGHFSVAVKGRQIDFRVSLTPSMHGQKLVIRVLDPMQAPCRLDELGLVPWMYEKLQRAATKDAGMVLACGPTGSGKTTTLYSCLREIDVVQRNAVTIEDPVEYSLEGCTQIPIDTTRNQNFATILRSVLRQDPDVIFVGEIRDIETANVAMQASMTGHLVYSTVHAKDSIGAIFRLMDLGVESYLVANALNMIIAQRLVRTLCPNCKRAVQPTPSQSMRLGGSSDGVAYIQVPVGCRQCLRTGYRGRRAIFELLEMNDSMRDIVLSTPSIKEIRNLARQGLFMTLSEHGYQLVREGITSIDEIDRVSGSD